MRKLTYLAVVEPGDEYYGIFFPDLPGCTSGAINIEDILSSAKEALNLHIYGMEKDHDSLPIPSKCLNHSEIEGCYIMPVTIEPELYRMKRENKKIETAVTLPLWMKKTADQEKIDLSNVLELSLLEIFQLK